MSQRLGPSCQCLVSRAEPKRWARNSRSYMGAEAYGSTRELAVAEFPPFLPSSRPFGRFWGIPESPFPQPPPPRTLIRESTNTDTKIQINCKSYRREP